MQLGELPEVNFIGRIKFTQPWSHFERIASEYILFVITSGDMYIQEDKTKYHLKAHDYLILSPGLKHFGYKKATCEYSFVHFKCQSFTSLEPKEEEQVRMNLMNTPLVIFHDEKPFSNYGIAISKHGQLAETQQYHAVKSQLDWAIDDYYSSGQNHPITCSASLLNVLVLLNRYLISENRSSITKHFSKGYVTALELKQFIESNTHRMLTAENIIERFNFNYDYLNRLMQKYFNTSIRQYIQITKVEIAKKIMTHNDIKMADVANLVGIENQFYFSKVFKKHVGMSPLDYYKKTHLVNEKTLKEGVK
jgi:AraC-like DNA-binding protein